MSRRVVYGWSLFFAAAVALMAGGIWWALGLATVSVLAGNEFIALVQAKGIRPSPRIIRAMIIAFVVVGTLPQVPGLHVTWDPLFAFPLVVVVGVCASFFRLLFRDLDPPATISDIATTILGFLYCGFMPSHLALLRNLIEPGVPLPANPLYQPGVAYVWVTLFIIFATDVFAYYGGKAFGKHLLYPTISPKKTVEGAVCGLLAAVFWSTAVVYVADHYIFQPPPFHLHIWQAPLMGLFASIGCQLGDLCESLLKRDAGVKDSGNLIPGHGGFLDRGDGLIFAGAICYYWIRMFMLHLL